MNLAPYAAEEVALPVPRRSALEVARDVLALTKPRITLVVLLTTASGIKLAHGRMSGIGWLCALVGTALLVGSANALNMWLERDVDGRMERTRNRPLPAGRLAPAVAVWFGAALSVVSLPILWLGTNRLATALGAVALVSYVLIYTPLKRRSMRALWVGAVPGAIPPLLGYAAVTGRIDWAGFSLFALLFVWQIPHFLAIASFRTDEYTRAGLKVAPAVLGPRGTDWMIVRYSLLLVAVSVWPYAVGLGGKAYLAVAAAFGAGWLLVAWRGFGAADRPKAARGLFAWSVLYLVVVFGTMVAVGG
jgi:protoheme IX farnesyltransferase